MFTFQSGANRLCGWDTFLERYKKSYSGENWGILDFTDLEVNVLGANCAYVIGRYKLALRDTGREGLFTIIFKRFPEGWRIIHDHSSQLYQLSCWRMSSSTFSTRSRLPTKMGVRWWSDFGWMSSIRCLPSEA